MSVQCHASTGYCWCADNRGEKIPNTERGPGQGTPDCGKWKGIPDFGHGHIGHPASGHLTSDIWTYDTGEGKWTLDTWTLDTWTLDTCIFIFPHAYEHYSRSNYINKILL